MNRTMRAALGPIAVIVTFACLKPVTAQTRTPEQNSAHATGCLNPGPENVRTFYLRNETQASDANEIYTAVRALLPPEVKTYFVPNQMAIELCAQPDQLALAQKLINDLDRPKKNYRLTYTVTETDGTTRVGAQHFSMIVTPGQQATLKQGSRVPIVTGSNPNHDQQVSYVDVGMNFDATVETTSDGVRLKTTVEQSSVAEGKGIGPEIPVIRQATFRGSSFLVSGKPLRLGTFDVADSNRHLDLEVSMEPMP